MTKRDSLKIIEIGQSAAKPRIEEGSTTKVGYKRLIAENGELPIYRQ